MSTTFTLPALTATEGCVFRLIEKWWRAIIRSRKTKGASSNAGHVCPSTTAPITRLSAADIRKDLLKDWSIDLTIKQIRTALVGLVTKGWIFRFKARAADWKQDYSYMPLRRDLGKYNPEKVGAEPTGVRLTPDEWWQANQQTEEVCPQGRDVLPSEAERTAQIDPIDVPSRELLYKEAVNPAVSPSLNPACPPDRYAASEPSEPTEPEVEPAQTPIRVLDAAPIEQTEPPRADEGSDVPSNTLNSALLEQTVDRLNELLEVWEYDPATDRFLWIEMDSCLSVGDLARRNRLGEESLRAAMVVLGLVPEQWENP